MPDCIHQWEVLTSTVEEPPDIRTMNTTPQQFNELLASQRPPFTHLLLVCNQCGDRTHESLPGRPVVR